MNARGLGHVDLCQLNDPIKPMVAVHNFVSRDDQLMRSLEIVVSIGPVHLEEEPSKLGILNCSKAQTQIIMD